MTYQKDSSLLARVAWMYYVQNLTQEEIGRKLQYSRTKVTRLLAKANEMGIVEFKINDNYRSCLDTEAELIKKFNLKEAIVVPCGDTIDHTREGLGKACADYLEKNLVEGDVLGCAWGRTLHQAGRFLRNRRFKNLTVIQLMGGLNTGGKINPQEILEIIASKLNARGIWLHTPAVVDSLEIRDALLSDEGVRKVLEQGRRCTKALVGIGDVTPTASLVASGALTIRELRQLRDAGAVGDIFSHFFDVEGKPVVHNVADRVIALGLQELKLIPVRIASTTGPEKVDAVLGAIRGGYINVLVIDEDTAKKVLHRGD